MFITLEGPDGSGKSTQMQPLVNFLNQQGYSVFTTREPGGTAISDQVRNILMRLDNRSMSPRAETLLFCAARAQLVEEEIRPRLEKGEIVLCDRYADFTLAYQGYGHGNDLTKLKQLLDFTTGELWPDLTVLFDLDALTGLNCRKVGGGEWNRMDDYTIAYHQRVREGYLEMARQEPQRWSIINAAQDIDAVQSDLRAIVMGRLTENR